MSSSTRVRMSLYTMSLHTIPIGLAMLTGCAGSGEGLDQNGRPSTPGSAGTALTADFNSIQDNVFTPVCTRCHAGATAPRGLRLDAANSYALLVGVASSEVPSLQRVQPGNPNASYLIQKLTGAAAVGQRMPLGGPYLPQSSIDTISQWITNGAPRPVAVAAAQKMSFPISGLSVVTTSPLNGALVEAPLTQIVAAFDRELDANRVDGFSVLLESLSEKHTVAARFSVPIANPSNLLINPIAALSPGVYRLTLRGAGGNSLAGLDAAALNSTGVHAEGGDEIVEFTVTASIEAQP